MNDTRRKLLDGAVETLRVRGIAGTSARAIAATTGVNQALIFYHFGSVDDLLDVACRDATQTRIDLHRSQFDSVTSMRELLQVGRELHVQEREAGNVAMLAQILAGAHKDPALAAAGRHALGLWVAEIEKVLVRVMKGSPIAMATDVHGLAHSVTASFIGIELYDGVDPDGAALALAALEQLSVLVEVVEDLGPVGRRALRSRMRRVSARANASADRPKPGPPVIDGVAVAAPVAPDGLVPHK